MVSGILNILYAAGLRRRLGQGKGGRSGPLLIGAYGLGLVAVGVFRTDPALGFPPGATASPDPSWHGIIHALGGLFVFLSLAAALLALGRSFSASADRVWAWYSRTSGLLVLALFFGAFGGEGLTARFTRLAVVVGWGAAAAVAMRLLAISRSDVPTPGST